MGKVQIIPFIALACVLMLLVTGSMAAPSKGVIYVDSNPDGAEIYLTNTSVSPDNLTVHDTAGITPREFFVDPGEYRLFLKKYGYITWWNESFTVAPESYQVFNITLTETNPQYGAIHIDTQPPGANLVLQRFIPNVTSVIYSSTPASVESLPPGTYNFTLTKDGYYPYSNTTVVKAGDVTELYVPLVPIPDSGIVTFKSEPNSARVVVVGGNFSALGSGMEMEIQEYLESYNGTPDEVSAGIKNIVGTETIPPIKFVYGLVGTTPFDMELYAGEYVYLYFLDGYSMNEMPRYFNVSAGEKKTIVETLIPDQEFVQVFFETNVDEEGGANVAVEGDELGTTPCWVSLPSHQIVSVTFDQMPLYAKKVVTVDTTLFEGRPSKWGEIIQLELMTYYLTASDDDHSTINPSGVIAVTAGNTQEFNLSGELPAWLVGNLTVHRDGYDPIVYPYNQPSAVYQHTKILQNATLSLTSVKKKVAVNATAGKGGSVNYPGITLYDFETPSNQYNFTANDGYVFKELWVDGEQKFNDKWDFPASQMIHNHTLLGLFRPTHVLITPVATTGGSILDGTSEATPYWIEYLGCTHQHEVVADPGYRFTYANFTSTDAQQLLSSESDKIYIGSVCDIDKNTTITAHFEPLNYTVNSRSADETKGIIVPALTNYTAGFGETLSFKSNPFAGYQLSEITDNGISKGVENPYNITVNEDHDIVAHFQSDVLTIEAVAGEGGIIEPEGSVNVTFGDSQCFNITANANYYISSVVIDGEDTGNQTSPYQYCFNNVTTDHNISAYFTQYAYTITPSAGVGGTISPSTPQLVPIGDSAIFTITPSGCYTIKDVQVDGESKGALSTYTFVNVTEDHTIHADFQIKTYEILVNQSEGGMIDPAGDDGVVTVNCGSTQCFNITPDEGNVVYDVIVDNNSVGVYNKYCFTNITDNHTLEAVFVIPPEPDFEADRTRVPPKYPVSFKDFTRNNPTDWLWDFGDGEITTTREPVHYFAEVGNYTVTLTAYNAAATDGVNKTKEHYIEVTTNPIAEFVAKSKGGILPPGVEIEFVDTSLNTEGVAYGWVFGDGPKGAISKNATHIYDGPGVYQVTHQVEKPFIAKDYAYETITILQKPEADFIAHPVSGKAPLTVQFEDRSQGFPTSWLWDFGDTVKSYDQNPVHIYSSSGNYTVSLSVFSDEGSSIKTKDGFITVQ
ncbi:PKD domain-containing protein [Methanospirillum purgamenti]|jgi:PKD repeat protein|uniref:PKD domain-containing protein n=1 Tax=Methanospirillum hungatei TaxID=2203 RepID=A0A8F5VMI8_METHU|nr:PKD domain-containing protein [Methanospirillum hungatei]QXO94841.1 PKD domain-containing protein [Methanospirillum hungatei]